MIFSKLYKQNTTCDIAYKTKHVIKHASKKLLTHMSKVKL